MAHLRCVTYFEHQKCPALYFAMCDDSKSNTLQVLKPQGLGTQFIGHLRMVARVEQSMHFLAE